MSNTILTSTVILRRALALLHEKSGFVGTINRQYDSQYAKRGAKIGDTLTIRYPNQYTVRTGKTINVQDTQETSTTITMATQKGVDMDFSSVELTLQLDDFSERILEPAVNVLAAHVQSDVLESVTKDVYNITGTPGTTPTTFEHFLTARAKLNQGLTPKDNNRFALIDSITSAAIVNGESGKFHDGKSLSAQYLDAVIGHAANLDFMESEMVLAHTNGTRDNTTPVTAGVGNAAQTGSTLLVEGLDAAVTVKQGDIFTIADVYAVHPETKKSYSHLQQFVVTADATADGGGAATLSISPSIIASGAYQNVSNSAADNKAIVFYDATASATHTQNLVYHRDFATFVSADLEMPEGVHFASMETFEGITMRIVRNYDINNDQFPCRLDVLYGKKTLRPQLACRVTR